MVTSFIPGRIRLRAPIFRDEELCEKARKILGKSNAVTKIEHNLLSGSILLHYDTNKVPMDKILPMQSFFLKLGNEAMHFSRANRARIISMLDELESLIKNW